MYVCFYFFFNDTATTEIYTLSLHDALPILRDIDIYIKEAESQGMRIAYSLETHVHNDFISGSRELAARTGAVVCASAAGGLVFEHRSLRGGDVIEEIGRAHV